MALVPIFLPFKKSRRGLSRGTSTVRTIDEFESYSERREVGRLVFPSHPSMTIPEYNGRVTASHSDEKASDTATARVIVNEDAVREPFVTRKELWSYYRTSSGLRGRPCSFESLGRLSSVL